MVITSCPLPQNEAERLNTLVSLQPEFTPLDGQFSAGANIPASALAQLVVCCVVLLALVLVSTTWLARMFGFDVEDEITIVFCGSKKSMATGVPMAQIIFSGGAAGLAILPLMVFHQIQLMVCAVMARRYAERDRLATALEQPVAPR